MKATVTHWYQGQDGRGGNTSRCFLEDDDLGELWKAIHERLVIIQADQKHRASAGMPAILILNVEVNNAS